MRRFLGKLVLVAVSSVFALALGEAGVRWLLDDDLRVETTGCQYKW